MKHEDRPAVVINGLNKTFKLPHDQHSGIKSLVLNLRKRDKGYEKQTVLRDVTFDIKQGEFFGIVGRNGSGKSTLLKLLAGIYTPDSGLVQVNGSLTPFIELGVGFNPELTGRENVYLNGALLGFGKKEMEAMYEDIVEFAELERFMDQKLKNYSSGMQVRLAFSIAIRARSDVLLLDEVLAVGDSVFQRKCYTYFKELKKRKQTVIFISHDTGALYEYCDRAALIDKGELVAVDKIEPILDMYGQLLNEDAAASKPKAVTPELGDASKKAFIKSAKVVLPPGKKYFVENEDVVVRATFGSARGVERPVFGITVSDATGAVVFQSNTLWRRTDVPDLGAGEEMTVEWKFPNAFNTGTYSIEPGVANTNGTESYHRVSGVCEFEVVKKQKSHGYINTTHDITLIDDTIN